MKKLLSFSLVLAMLLSLILTAAATDKPAFDTSVFVVPESLSKAGFDGIECMDIDLGLYHLIPVRNGGSGDYFQWTGRLETIPANVEENECCFTSATRAPKTVIFFDGVPNLPKDMFKWWEGKTTDIYIPDSVTEIDEDAFVMNSTITLHFSANNAVALAYAEARGMNYEIVPEPEEVSEPDTSEPHASEPVSDPAAFDASIFEVPDDLETYSCCDCACSDCQSVYHYVNLKEGITFYQWVGGDGKMAPRIGGCFSRVPHETQAFEFATVVFWNGVPNLVKDLFKKWESCTHDVYIPDSVTEIDEDCFVEGSHITLHFTANNEVALAYAEARGMNYEIVPEPDASEPASGTVTMDTSIFFEHPEEPAECMDEMLMGLCHEYKHDINDIVFFGWSGRFEKMPPCEADSCFGAMVQLPATVVFLDGVPNLVNDLFKEWEGKTKDVYIPDSVTEIDEDCFVKGSHITLHFTKNNAVALTYAQTRGMAFEVMDGERLPGDVNFDKSVDMKDTLSLRKSIANLPAAYEIYSLDINGDGNVDMKDVLKVRLRIWYDSLSPSEQILASFFGWF